MAEENNTYLDDERPQLDRLRKERDRYNNLRKEINYYICTGIFYGIIIFIFVYILDIENIKVIGYAEIIFVFAYLCSAIMLCFSFYRIVVLDRSIGEIPLFYCYKCGCSTSSTDWKCGSCRRDYILTFTEKTAGRVGKVLGELCDQCEKMPSHFTCPHCHKDILLNASVPETRPAIVPGYKPPPAKEAAPQQEKEPPPRSLSSLLDDDLR